MCLGDNLYCGFFKFKSSVFVITSLNTFDYALMMFLLSFFKLMSLCN